MKTPPSLYRYDTMYFWHPSNAWQQTERLKLWSSKTQQHTEVVVGFQLLYYWFTLLTFGPCDIGLRRQLNISWSR